MVHKTAVAAQLAALASAGGGVGARNGTALFLTSRAHALRRAGNSKTSSATGETKFPRTGYVPQPTFRDRFRAQLLDTACRVDSCVTHSKQTTEARVTRHKNEGGVGTDFPPQLGGASSFRRRRWTAIGPVAATNSAQRKALRAPLSKGCPP